MLEIGTGSGYNAALMSHRLGARQITTVEVDHRLCTRAEAVLHRCGYAPTVVCGDGTNGYEVGAPYDRVIATCFVPSIPISWIDQTTAGGLILAGLYRPLGGGPLVRLTAAGDGTAQGVFLPGGGGFMPVRDHPTPDAMPLFKTAMATEPDRPPRSSAVPPDVFDHTDFGMLAALVLEDVTTIQFQPADGDEQRWLLASNGAWACLDIATKTVTQRGPRYLWDELEATFATWRRAGEPTREQTGLTVTLDRQWIWLHHPDQPVWPCG